MYAFFKGYKNMRRLIWFFKFFLIVFVGSLSLMSYRADLCSFLGSFPSLKAHLYCLRPRKIHIFIDYATTPTLLQMIEFIKLPKEDIKFVSWDRYRHYLPIMKKIQSNVTEWTFNEPHEQNMPFIQNELKKITNRFVNPQFYLYFNYKHVGWEGHMILKSLPLEKVKALHLYEDGTGTFLRTYNRISSDTIIRSIQDYVQRNQITSARLIFLNQWLNILPYLYPTYLHVMVGHNTVSVPANVTLVSVNFAKLKKRLSVTEKKKLFKLLNFQPLIYKKRLGKKKMGIYLYDGFNKSYRAKAISTLKQDLLKMNNVVWFSKQHPRVAGTQEDTKGFIPIKETFIPLEAFLLSNLPIEYIAGEGSSAFYSVPPEMIVGYVPNPERHYTQHLLKLKILTPDKIYDWHKPKKE